MSGIDNSFLSTGLSGVVGVLLTFAIGGGLFWLLRRRRQSHSGDADGQSSSEVEPPVRAGGG